MTTREAQIAEVRAKTEQAILATERALDASEQLVHGSLEALERAKQVVGHMPQVPPEAAE